MSGLVSNISTTAGVHLSSSTTATQYIFPKRGNTSHARVSIYGSGTVSVAYSLSLQDVPVTIAANIWGQVAEGSTIGGNPVTIGLEARTSNKTSVGNGQVVRPIGTVDGKMIIRPHSIPESEWNYVAAAGGILDTTTAVTIKSGAGVGVRNYITSLQIQSEALATATELAIRESPGGTTIWRIKIPTTGLPLTTIVFADPIRSPANSLLEVVTLTASGTGAVYFNAQGYVTP